MGKKKKEHILFDQMLRIKKNIPFSKVNSANKNSNKHQKTIKHKEKSVTFEVSNLSHFFFY